MREIAPFHVMDILGRTKALEAQGRDIIHLEIGEPDFPTPQPIVRAGIEALRAGHTAYTPSLGLPELRAAIARHYFRTESIEVNPACVALTPGASGALQLALAATLLPGDAVLMADPGYPCNRNIALALGCCPIDIPVGPDTDYQLDVEHVGRHWTPRTRAVLVASPSNPTGTLLPTARLDALRALCHERGARLIVDEIYLGLTYEGEARSAARHDDVLVVNSFSKYFLMTGWRLGWLLAPDDLIAQVERLAQNLFLAPPTVSQHAALAAFLPETLQELEARKNELQSRRDRLLEDLPGLGFDIPVRPQGAFYIYAGISRIAADSFAFSRELLERTGVAITPGMDFGAHAAQHHVRIAYTAPEQRLSEAVRRVGTFRRA